MSNNEEPGMDTAQQIDRPIHQTIERGNGRTNAQWRIRAERMLKTFRAIALLAVMLGWAGSAAGLVLSTTTLTSGLNPSAAGQAVILTATVTGATSSTISGTPPTGTVTFKDGTTVLSTNTLAATSGGTVTLSTLFTTAGTHSLTALYSGDANTAASTSLAVVQTVQHVTRAYFIHSDHLDTPRMITDTSGNVVWQWDNSDPFGNNPPNENPSGLGQFNFNLRFPGQYADKETNTYYNANRDYDPATGRYVESDPIGLRGGSFSTFTYVGGNPLSYIDPFGLFDINAQEPGVQPVCIECVVLPAARLPSFLQKVKTWCEAETTTINSQPAWPGNDPTKGPAGTEWRGKPGSQSGSSDGNYYNPNTGESYRPDLNHSNPIGPHWDYKAPDGTWSRIYPDGRVIPK